jgi:cobalt-zinc-cadmium efflux system outer membrane protein
MTGPIPRTPAQVLALVALVTAGCASVSPTSLPPVPAPTARDVTPPSTQSVVTARHETPAAAATQPPEPAGPLTLEQLLQLAQAHNPVVQRDAARVESARGQVLQAGLYPNPNFDGGNPQTFGGRNNTTLVVGLGQEVVTGGKLRLDTAAAEQALRQAQLTFDQDRLQLVADVRRQFYTVLAARQRAKVLAELATIVEAAAETGRKLEKAGETGRIDTLLLLTDSQTVRANLQRAETTLAYERKQLAATAGVPGIEAVELAGDLTTDCRPDFDEELVRRYAIDESTLIRVARAEVTRRHILLKRARVEPVPNVYIGPVYQFGLTPGSEAFGLNLTFPIPVWNLNQGNIRAATADIRDAEMSLKVTQNEQLGRVAGALGRYRSARQVVDRYERDILPTVRQAQKLAQEGYAKGVFDFARYLQAQRTVVESSLSYVESLESLWTAAADVAGLLQIEHLPCPPTPAGPAPVPEPLPQLRSAPKP